ncbi:MAG: fructose-bisphosphatase class III, partial [Bacilli bacterium]|nr:fructose-bisphosphatase class III [Bacilli bacterium]
GVEDAIQNNTDIVSTTVVYESTQKRLRVADTDVGKELKEQVENLKLLLIAYRQGIIAEKN